jgi:imidazole glycerol-phosphate synthase subunit HisH
MIGIVDYGAGNIGSVMNMLKRLSIPAVRASTPDSLKQAHALILPGVGAFDYCMTSFNASGLRDTVETIVASAQKPLLGICVGLQMMFRFSEEGHEPGLGWIDGEVVRFNTSRMDPSLKIPHMGWNSVQPKDNCRLLANIENPRFYFVHSYHPVCTREEDVSATVKYGYDFCCAIARGHLHGAQFHPEKSHRYGMAFLRNFAALAKES